MWHGTDVTQGGLFSPFAGGCCCQHSLMWDLAAALARELPGPFSGADPDAHPNPKVRSWSKYVSQSEVIMPRRGFIPLHCSGSRNTLAGTEPKRFARLDTQRSCHAVSWVWWSFLSHHQRLYLFPKPVLPADRTGSCRALPQLSALTFGISPQDGYSRGSSRTSFSRLSHPACSRPSADSRADQPSPSPGPVPQQQRDPEPGGSLGPGHREGERWVAGTPPPALQGTDAFRRASQALLPFT